MAGLRTLLDADYILRNEKPVVRLFYKTENGREVEEVTDFKPYFYAIPVEATSELKKAVLEIEGIVGAEPVKMIDMEKEIDVLKIFATIPRDVAELRGKVRGLDECKEVREADIPFAKRYLIDSGLVPMENAEEINLNVAAFDIEVLVSKGEPKADRDPVIMISYADSKGMERVWTYRGASSGLDYLEVVADEKSMIERFIKTVNEQEIDILLGYNTDNFDFPYLKERADKLNTKLTLGLDGGEVRLERRGMNLGARVRGRPHVDLYPVCRQVFNLPRYRLEDVYLEVAGEEKEDINVRDIPKFWNSEDDFKILAEYSLSDAVAVLKISEALLPLQYELSRIVKQPIYEVSRMGSGQRVENLLIEHAFEKKILVPNRPSDSEIGERQVTSYVGAYVVEPEKGIHDNIVLFDFRSLYPSIIISHNVDPATLDCNCCKDGFVAPNKHHFCKKNRGFIPEILGGIIARRIEIKKRLKEGKDPEKDRVLDVQQHAIKILANSMYGYYAFQRARWYCRPCAEAITGWGREYIHKTIDKAKSYGFDVIYGDTDSIFIVKPDEADRSRILEDAKGFKQSINDELPEAMELELEGFYPRGIFITKKRYALIDEKGKITVKGLETRRRDWSNVAKETQDKVLDAILRDKDPAKAAETVKEVVQNIKQGNVKLKDLTINTQMTRNLGEYVQPGPHIIAVKRAMKEGMDFKQGDIITYVVTKKGTSISDKARVIDFVKEGEYDPNYYINNQVLPAVMRILEALGYSEDELKGLGKQTRLGSW